MCSTSLARIVGIEPDRGLVHQQQVGPVEQGAGDFDPALVAARKRADALVDEVAHLQQVGGVGDAGLEVLAGEAEQRAVKFEIAGHRHIEIDRAGLKHHAEAGQNFGRMLPVAEAEDFDTAGIGLEQAGGDLEQGGFSSAVRPQQPDDFAAADVEADALEGFELAVGFADGVEVENGLGIAHGLVPST